MKLRKKYSKKWWKIFLSAVLVGQGIITLYTPSPVLAADVNLKLNAKSAVLMEASTGQILYQQNANEALPPASMTKMMTEYIVLNKIKDGQIHWDDKVTISKYAAHVGGSGQLLGEGQTFTVKDLFYEMSIYSGNDAAVSLAEYVAGTEQNFVKLMNEKAKEIHLSAQAHFSSATGLAPSDISPQYRPSWMQGETVFTALDAANLARHLIKDQPEILQFTKIPEKKFFTTSKQSVTLLNWNRMLEGWKNVGTYITTAYKGMDGLKTGHTDAAGYCFTGTAQRNGMRLISIVMHTKSRAKSFEETQKLMDYGFNNFVVRTVLPAKTQIKSLSTVNIKKGVETTVPVVTDQGVIFVVKKQMKPDEIQTSAQTINSEKLVAPIKQGDVLGDVTLTYDGISKKVNLIATKDVKKASWFTLLTRAIGHFFHDIFSSISDGVKKLI